MKYIVVDVSSSCRREGGGSGNWTSLPSSGAVLLRTAFGAQGGAHQGLGTKVFSLAVPLLLQHEPRAPVQMSENPPHSNCSAAHETAARKYSQVKRIKNVSAQKGF